MEIASNKIEPKTNTLREKLHDRNEDDTLYSFLATKLFLVNSVADRFGESASWTPPINVSRERATMEDRRQHKRHAFSATAEVMDMVSGARLPTRAADLNKGGCYLDMLNPLPIGSNVRVSIHSDGAELTCTAVVRDSQPGMGMGVAFTDLDDARTALIESWIERLVSPALVNPSLSPPSENAKPAPPPEQRDALALRLIELLHK